ncbi:hypothetical protein ACOMHN_046537 [Nucella lapillus]
MAGKHGVSVFLGREWKAIDRADESGVLLSHGSPHPLVHGPCCRVVARAADRQCNQATRYTVPVDKWRFWNLRTLTVEGVRRLVG